MANDIKCIGVIGTGVQAKLQIEYLKKITDCKDIIVWGRNEDKVKKYSSDMNSKGFKCFPISSVKDLCKQCNLIISATASKTPIIFERLYITGNSYNSSWSRCNWKKRIG